MPKYVKFMTDLLTQRGRGNEASKITLNERCLAVVLNKIPLKEKDPGSFTIPCIIGQGEINNALADLRSSISLMPYSMFLGLNLGELKPARMCIDLANKSTQIPRGIAENIIVKIDRFVFPVDFMVLDIKEDRKIPIILERPFLATAHAMIDVFNKKIFFEVGDETITFDIEKSMRFPPSDDDTCHSVDMIDLSILDHVQEILPSEPFDSLLFEPINHHLPTKINSLWDDNGGEQDLINQISGDLKPESKGYTKPTLFVANMFEGEKPTTKLKDLPSHLEYAFFGHNNEFPIIISSLLSTQEKELLLGVLMRKLNDAIRKDHIPLPFIDQMLERLSGNEYYCFLDGFSGYFQIPLAPEDQEKTTFTCPYGTFSYRRMPFGLCNAPATFQLYMTAIFHDMCKDFMEVFMDDFSVFGNSFDSCLNNLSKILARCEETNLVLNWEKCHFMVKKGIVLVNKISKARIEVDKSKVDVITKLPYPTNIKGMQSFSGHTGFYRRFIKDFSKIARPMTQILTKDTEFVFSNECIKSFDILRNKLTTALGSENLVADHLSRLENPELEELDEDAIRDSFPDEHLMVINIKEAKTDPWYVDHANFHTTLDISFK
ncbi:reverse transcriptase domain-containing protein [Tanacetum coccineum]